MRWAIFGGGGFIGSHLVRRLKASGEWVRVVDLKRPEFSDSPADDYIQGDLRESDVAIDALEGIDILVQLAADMGGAGYIFTGENDLNIMTSSCQINLNAIAGCLKHGTKKALYSSSACIYPARNQTDPNAPDCKEDTAYPAAPDSEYGWEKLFSERLWQAAHKNAGLDVRICRFHNVYGPEGTWTGGKEKAPAAICRKVAEASDTIEIWGPGTQTRSFLYIDDAIDGVLALLKSDAIAIPLNIGSEEMISINDMAKYIVSLSEKQLAIKNIPGPVGVMGRNSNNDLVRKLVGWEPRISLSHGLTLTYSWISAKVEDKYKDKENV
jgi:nucleoside-diphosphate-sugar epimerase